MSHHTKGFEKKIQCQDEKQINVGKKKSADRPRFVGISDYFSHGQKTGIETSVWHFLRCIRGFMFAALNGWRRAISGLCGGV